MPNSASHRTACPLLPLRRTPAAKAESKSKPAAMPKVEPDPENDIRVRFGRRLRELRLEQNRSQPAFAKHAHIDRSFLSEVENGHSAISLPMLEAVALGLEIDLTELLEGVMPPLPRKTRK